MKHCGCRDHMMPKVMYQAAEAARHAIPSNLQKVQKVKRCRRRPGIWHIHGARR